jgi:hypothetical protein
LVSTVPWDDACASLRFSVTFAARDAADEQRVLADLAGRLGDVTFEFQGREKPGTAYHGSGAL